MPHRHISHKRAVAEQTSAMPPRTRSAPQHVSWDDVPALLPPRQPPVAVTQLPISDFPLFGRNPLTDPLDLVVCAVCSRCILHNAFPTHKMACIPLPPALTALALEARDWNRARSKSPDSVRSASSAMFIHKRSRPTQIPTRMAILDLDKPANSSRILDLGDSPVTISSSLPCTYGIVSQASGV